MKRYTQNKIESVWQFQEYSHHFVVVSHRAYEFFAFISYENQFNVIFAFFQIYCTNLLI